MEEWGRNRGGVEKVEWCNVEFNEYVDGVIVELIDERGEELFDDQTTEDSVAMFTKILKNILFWNLNLGPYKTWIPSPLQSPRKSYAKWT